MCLLDRLGKEHVLNGRTLAVELLAGKMRLSMVAFKTRHESHLNCLQNDLPFIIRKALPQYSPAAWPESLVREKCCLVLYLTFCMMARYSDLMASRNLSEPGNEVMGRGYEEK